jgi:hypothetical protein
VWVPISSCQAICSAGNEGHSIYNGHAFMRFSFSNTLSQDGAFADRYGIF